MRHRRWLQIAITLAALGAATQAQAQTYYTVNIQAQSGHYVVAENNGNDYMNADRGSAGSWETFTLIDEDGGDLESGDLVYIVTGNGYYAIDQCFAPPFPGNRMRATALGQGCATAFGIDKYDNANNLVSGPIYPGDQVVFSGYHGIWQAENGGGARLFVLNVSVGAWEKFFLWY